VNFEAIPAVIASIFAVGINVYLLYSEFITKQKKAIKNLEEIKAQHAGCVRLYAKKRSLVFIIMAVQISLAAFIFDILSSGLVFSYYIIKYFTVGHLIVVVQALSIMVVLFRTESIMEEAQKVIVKT
jgi:hypothetical protein